MQSFPWTKFQDFYLRLGFLKVLTCALDSGRRSASNQSIDRRLTVPLFEPAAKYERCFADVQSNFAEEEWCDPRDPVTVAEALLIKADAPSVLFAITRKTTYKILDWGHDVYFVGRGNQITERALVLKALLPEERVERFFAGEVEAWNPFDLTTSERLFFLYHLGELDQLMLELPRAVATQGSGRHLESSEAARLTCETFFAVLRAAEPRLHLRDIPRFRTAHELACAIAEELELTQFARDCGSYGGRRTKIGRIGAKRPGLMRPGEKARKTTKNADHQTIPRFEQLTDLGFVEKPSPVAAERHDDISCRKRWKYQATDLATRWKVALDQVGTSPEFFTNGFAKTAVATYGLANTGPNEPTDEIVARYFGRAYESMRRPVGHTPFDSVALLAMIYAVADGVAIEIEHFHRLMLSIKKNELLPSHAFFASGNEIDKMFLLLKPGFLDAFVAATRPNRETRR